MTEINLHTAVATFLVKFDECEPHVTDAFFHRQLRYGPYTGPQYGEELEAVRSAHIANSSDVSFASPTPPAAEPSEEVVERVARAMAEDGDNLIWNRLPDKHDIACGHGMPEGCKDYWRILARVALKALRSDQIDQSGDVSDAR